MARPNSVMPVPVTMRAPNRSLSLAARGASSITPAATAISATPAASGV